MNWLEREHYPATLPVLRWHGSPVDPTRGDVDAIFAGTVRLVRGETICARGPNGIAIEVRGTTVRVGDRVIECESSHDALVVAYGEINDFNEAWAAFHGDAEAAA